MLIRSSLLRVVERTKFQTCWNSSQHAQGSWEIEIITPMLLQSPHITRSLTMVVNAGNSTCAIAQVLAQNPSLK
jgi:hypothetical protein